MRTFAPSEVLARIIAGRADEKGRPAREASGSEEHVVGKICASARLRSRRMALHGGLSGCTRERDVIGWTELGGKRSGVRRRRTTWIRE